MSETPETHIERNTTRYSEGEAMGMEAWLIACHINEPRNKNEHLSSYDGGLNKYCWRAFAGLLSCHWMRMGNTAKLIYVHLLTTPLYRIKCGALIDRMDMGAEELMFAIGELCQEQLHPLPQPYIDGDWLKLEGVEDVR